ncbi:MAG TPA: HD domain-containing protein [Planctomycetaceae bacterium]|nr:HD domain-containing protein [Planctomycetaceae bacterium]
MSDPTQTYEIRCPVHGFIKVNDWEWGIIAEPAFQRLRRIRQLAWTDQVYPGAMHTRFEHSLGVMHVASTLYDAIVERSKEVLESELTYNADGLRKDRILVRLTALLHDVGHCPFSHAGEALFPFLEDGDTRYRHEHYSAAIIRSHLRAAIENHPLNQNYRINADEIAALLENSASAGRALFWRELIDGQMDADRMDYLLRDSLHAGVDYGKFDWRRLVHCVQVVPGANGRGPRLGVSEGGFHAAEALVLARYFMFTQVYFHKTRVAFDHHLQRALTELLPSGRFPRPLDGELDEFLKWDDWRVFGALANGQGGDHGRRLAVRDHYREVFHTPESPRREDIAELKRVRKCLGGLVQAEERADKSWYKVGSPDIPVVSNNPGRHVAPLSAYSPVVGRLRAIDKTMIFCRSEDVEDARRRIQALRR